jgi:hypothetical protein
MKFLTLLLIWPLLAGCITNDDPPWLIEANGATIVVPVHGYYMRKILRNSIHGLTTEQTKILSSAVLEVTNAVMYSLFENRYENLKDQFSESGSTFYYKYVLEHSITDRRGGIDIVDWEVTPRNIAFTIYSHVTNDSDDGYWEGEDDYYMKFRDHFVTNDENEGKFVRNEFIGFAHDVED